MKNFALAINLPTELDPQTVTREVAFQVNSGEQVIVSATVADTSIDAGRVNEGDVVVINLTDLDDAGNRSEPSTLTITVTDVVAPQQPGELAVTLSDEQQV